MPKLLLADDSVTIQRVIELTFADENVQVVAVGDGQQAIDRIKADRPDIVLADIGMPERDGYDVASFVKSTPEFSHIPVLLLTGAFEPVDEARARSVGADGVLVKPFEPQMVIARVRELLNHTSDTPAAPALVAARPLSAAATSAPPAKPVSSVGTAELDRLEPEAPAGGSRDALEDYFDRLDAAPLMFRGARVGIRRRQDVERATHFLARDATDVGHTGHRPLNPAFCVRQCQQRDPHA